MTSPRFKRILLKLSGEVLMGDGGMAIDPAVTARVAGEIADAKAAGYELCVVVGGGNIFRGHGGRGARDGPGDRRLHGHARDRHERAGSAERAGTAGGRDPGPVRDPDGQRVRIPSSAAAAPNGIWKRAAWVIFAAGGRQPVLHPPTAAPHCGRPR